MLPAPTTLVEQYRGIEEGLNAWAASWARIKQRLISALDEVLTTPAITPSPRPAISPLNKPQNETHLHSLGLVHSGCSCSRRDQPWIMSVRSAQVPARNRCSKSCAQRAPTQRKWLCDRHPMVSNTNKSYFQECKCRNAAAQACYESKVKEGLVCPVPQPQACYL